MKIGNILNDFCDATGADPKGVAERWAGRPDHIIEDIFRLPNEKGELHPVSLFKPWQPKYVHAYFYGDSSTINLLKGRRIGGTAIALLCMALEGIILPGQLYPIVSTTEKQSYSRISDLTDLYKNAVIDIPMPTSNKGYIELWNGTQFVGYTGAPDSSRGDGARSILFDEMAFMERQQEMLRAYRPMMSLSTGKMLQVSTPNASNDEFMKTHNRGSETGFSEDDEKIGVISIKQPTFKNYEEIDIERSLFQQRLEPARPDLNIDVVEQDRAQDPMGFAQEYLCIPASEEYQFFSPDSVELARSKAGKDGHLHGLETPRMGGVRFMGIDVGYQHDDTVISVFDHVEDYRYQKYVEVVTNNTISASGIRSPDRENVKHVARRIADVFSRVNCDYLIIDATGSGSTLPALLREYVGSAVIPFNFSDVKKVRDMFYKMNEALRNERVVLVPSEVQYDQLVAIQRIQKKDNTVPRFTGKDTAPDGKDDVAMATVMAAFPPGYDDTPSRSIESKQYDVPKQPRQVTNYDENRRGAVFASGGVSRSGPKRSYQSRHGRR